MAYSPSVSPTPSTAHQHAFGKSVRSLCDHTARFYFGEFLFSPVEVYFRYEGTVVMTGLRSVDKDHFQVVNEDKVHRIPDRYLDPSRIEAAAGPREKVQSLCEGRRERVLDR